MRNNEDAERIALTRKAAAHQFEAAYEAERREHEAERRKFRFEVEAASIGPPAPIGSRVYPINGFDDGLRKLRDKCYAQLRAKHQERA